MKIKSVNKSDFITTSWSGGTTTEYFIYPAGASYKERQFKARISSAVIEDDYSKFTSLEGVTRYLSPLSGEIELIVSEKSNNLCPHTVIKFSGEEKVESYGRCRDFNLMLKGTEGSMKCEKINAAGIKLLLEKDYYTVVYCYDGKVTVSYQKEELTKIKDDFTDKNRMLIFSSEVDMVEEINLSSDDQFVIICKIKK